MPLSFTCTCPGPFCGYPLSQNLQSLHLFPLLWLILSFLSRSNTSCPYLFLPAILALSSFSNYTYVPAILPQIPTTPLTGHYLNNTTHSVVNLPSQSLSTSESFVLFQRPNLFPKPQFTYFCVVDYVAVFPHILNGSTSEPNNPPLQFHPPQPCSILLIQPIWLWATVLPPLFTFHKSSDTLIATIHVTSPVHKHPTHS